jgi:hypothetical protein
MARTLVAIAVVSLLGFAAWRYTALRTDSTIALPVAQKPPLRAGESISPDDPIAQLVVRLDLDRYKATIQALTRFGDRRQGTDRNRAALDWIAGELKRYGCDPERHQYHYQPPAKPRVPLAAKDSIRRVEGGSRLRGTVGPRRPNNDPNAQPDAKLRELNSQPSSAGIREQIYCTKVGTVHPDEMYIIGAHMDGIGWGEAANDNASGTALVMELARVLGSSDVETDKSIRFALWNNEETGLDGASAYVKDRAGQQGVENPVGSRRYPEPRWLAMIQHDMMLWDHGMPKTDGTYSPEQRPEADVNIEFQMDSRFADDAMKLAFYFREANEKYSTDYPAAVGPHMTNTDSTPFMNLTPAISLRENERGMHTGAGWNPHWHQPSDVFATFSDKDFRLGLNAAQTTLGAIAELVGARWVERDAKK